MPQRSKPPSSKPPTAPTAKPIRQTRWQNLWQRGTLALGIGFGFSLLAHAALLAARFVPDDDGLRKQRELLPIVLVNAKHAEPPGKATAIAQANMAGGGNSDRPDMATSPLRPNEQDQSGDALLEARRRIEALEARQRALLAQAQAQIAIDQAIGRRRDAQPTGNAPQKGEADEDRTRAMSRQEALVDRQLREYAQRPRKNFISPSTRESPSTLYWVDWRRGVEALGTRRFPRDATGRPLYGSVLLSVEIERNGRLLEVRVEHSSGNPQLDRAAMDIVRLGSPYKPLPPSVTRDYDVLVVVDRFNFQDTQSGASLDISGQPAR